MSYRDLRNFKEMMQELGYPRLISMENFRTPNFPLVAEMLVWLVKRFDPDINIPLDIVSESERVALIRSIAQILVLKADLKVNTKKLYQADGYAVKEILKVTSMLHNALKTANSKSQEVEDDECGISVEATAIKAQEVKRATQLVGTIVTSGASLFDFLGREVELRELRSNKMSRHLEMHQVEQAVKDSIAHITKEIENTKGSVESIITSESTLSAKIEKKKSDLERHIKRLQTLKKIRPAFMEEFEKLEEELKELYGNYVIKYRNMTYLENILEQAEQAEQKRINQRIVARKLVEDSKLEENGSEEIFSEAFEENLKLSVRPREASRKTTLSKGGEEERKERKIFGSMTGGQDTESLDSDSDSDLLLDGDITEDDIEMEREPPRDMSDDDF